MKDVFLISYAVQGIKTLDKRIQLSFYKKTITKNYSIRGYNIKGIYGTNGAGKSAIISSIRILKSLIINDSYLSNPVVQKQLDALVNKHLKFLEMEAVFLVSFEAPMLLYRYRVKVEKNETSKYSITSESLDVSRATSHSDIFDEIFRVENGSLFLGKWQNERIGEFLIDRSKNLLSNSSLASLYFCRMLLWIDKEITGNALTASLIALFLFGHSLYAYLDNWDDHTDYIVNSILSEQREGAASRDLEKIMTYKNRLREALPYILSDQEVLVSKRDYPDFEKEVKQLYNFLHIFMPDLQSVTIDKKEDADLYRCSLLMQYLDYKGYAEFESTGIRKLIRLFSFLKRAAEGEIVFIDELDANLHDVYLCALLEYLMEYGEGQLCFTTHNIGPMDILKKNKKSIDFLSVDKQVYSWKSNGNYSPSNLYKNGMIEGSPFNVDSIDFIGVFQPDDAEGEG